MFMNYLEGLQFADTCIKRMINNTNSDSGSDSDNITIVVTKDM